jgi:alanyl-tRNA synthetase
MLQVKSIGELLKAKDPFKAVEKLADDKMILEKKIEKLEDRHLSILSNRLLNEAEDINGSNFIGQVVDADNADALKKLCTDIKQQLKNVLIVLGAEANGKAFIAIGIDEELAINKDLDAVKLIKELVAPAIKGGGGGQKTLAAAGGQDASQLKNLIHQLKDLL